MVHRKGEERVAIGIALKKQEDREAMLEEARIRLESAVNKVSRR